MKNLLWLLFFVSYMSACNHNPVDESNRISEENSDRLFQRNPVIDSLAIELIKQVEIHEYYNFHENKPFYALCALLLKDTNLEYVLESCIAEYETEETQTKNLYTQLGLKPILETDYDEAYRFSLTRAFEDKHVIITASRIKNTKKIETIAYNYSEGETFDMPIFSVTNRSEIILNASQWARLLDKLEKASFWSLAPYDRNGGFDGSTWIIESKTTYPFSTLPRHHYVNRWSPYDGSAFKEIGLYLIELSGHVPGKIY